MRLFAIASLGAVWLLAASPSAYADYYVDHNDTYTPSFGLVLAHYDGHYRGYRNYKHRSYRDRRYSRGKHRSHRRYNKRYRHSYGRKHYNGYYSYDNRRYKKRHRSYKRYRRGY